MIVASLWLGWFHASWAMKAKHRKKVLRRCAHCGQPFVVNPRVGKLHQYCSAPACVGVRKTKSNQEWLENYQLSNEGKPFFSGGESTALARMQQERETLERDYRLSQDRFGENSLHLNSIQRHVKRLFDNAKIRKFLSSRYPELLEEFQDLVALEVL